MTANFDTNETALTLWVAYCSNKDRTLDECLQKTRELLAPGGTEVMTEWASRELTTIYLNRGKDLSFLEGLFAEDNETLAMGCVRTALDAWMQGEATVDVDAYFTRYTARYGESSALLAARLRWLTLYTNYPNNTAEVERIMAILSPAPATTPKTAGKK